MKTMTIRNVPIELAHALDKERRKRGTSLNRTVLALLRNALGVPNQAVPSNGLRQLAGSILTVVQHRSAAKCLWLTIAADFCVHGLYRSFPAARYPIPIPCPPSMNTT